MSKLRPGDGALRALSIIITLTAAGGVVRADVPGAIGRSAEVSVDSGMQQNLTVTPQVVFQEVVRVDDASWLRIIFDQVNLGHGSYLRLTSLADGAVQELDAVALQQWYHTSAFFNGDAIRIELIAAPGTRMNSVSINEVHAGWAPVIDRTQCGTTDDRVASNHPAVARMLTAGLGSGCTATIYTAGGCMVTAGHCIGQPVVQFNVPPSLAGGGLQHPGPQDQYTVNDPTITFTNGGIGNDWGVFQCHPNTQTGLTVYEAQESYIPFAEGLAPVGSTITIYGYGADVGTANQTQQISVGPINSYSGTAIYHRADTEGGNSGSSILDEQLEIIGVHTNAGCTTGGGANSGTNITNAAFSAAVASAQLFLSLPNGPTAFIHPENGGSLVAEVDAGCEVPDTVELFVRVDGGAFQSTAMSDQGGGLYEGEIPGAPCGSDVEFYVQVTSTQGTVITMPSSAPADTYSALVVSGTTTLVDLDFQSSPGWTVSSTATVGAWQLGVPVNNNRGDPPTDSDGSGQCWLTANFAGDSDVDGGATTLLSPVYDLSGLADPYVQYDRWYDNAFGAAPFTDTFVVDVSNNGGGSWVNLETVGPAGPEVSGGWFTHQARLTDVITPTATMQFRFIASDFGDGSVVEAAVDAFSIYDVQCVSGVCGDFDDDGDVDLADFGVFTQCFGGSFNPPAVTCPGGTDADCDDDGDVDLADFATFSQNFTGSL